MESRKELQEQFKTEILEMVTDKEVDMTDINNDYELYDALDYDGSIHEMIDKNIDIYYHDLRQWAVDNYDYVEDAVNEGLVDTSDFDYHKAIQWGQYVYLREVANDALTEAFNELQESLDDAS